MGRVADFYVQEGDTVKAGDTLVCIHSSLTEAKLTEVEAMQNVARAQDKKVDAGTRSQIIQAAADLVEQAKAAATITRKTYERMESLYKQGVISEQKRDEAKAAYDAAVASQHAAESQLSLARQGAQSEDKQAASALVTAAGGGVSQVKAVLEDAYLVAPADGTIDQIYPELGELVAAGAPIMTLLRDDRYVIFNVRETMLKDFTIGAELPVYIPALDREVNVKIYYVRDMGSYATWRATKSTGEWDSRTFQVKARPTETVKDLRPGMTIVYRK
jgi:HlyD family secretion protein